MDNLKSLTDLPNIGKVLAEKLSLIGINNEEDLKMKGSEQTIVELSRLENSGVCINMFMALEGAIQRIRWHHLDKEKKEQLKEFFATFILNPIK